MVKKAAQATPNQLLRRARLERGWTQRAVADFIGAPNDTMVTRWERGMAFPSPYYIERLCQIFEKKASELGLLPASTSTEPSFSGGDRGDEQELKQPATKPVSPFVFDPTIPQVARNREHIVGRANLLQQVKQLLAKPADLTAIALHGLPGVGKTTLTALLAADPEVQECFPDGVLWAGLGPVPNLQGVLERWATLLNVPITQGERAMKQEELIQQLRLAIGRRRMLLVIDDAWTEQEALALHMGGDHSMHLLTTRLPQIAFTFAPRAQLHVPELDTLMGRQLLAQYVPSLVQEQPEAITDLVSAVGGLPLALTLLGRYLASQALSGQPRRLQTALLRLRERQYRLQISMPLASSERSLESPSPTSLSLHTAIALSTQTLDAETLRVFCALSVFPAKPASFTEEAALAVTQCSLDTLDTLWDMGLLEASGPARYMLHQTIREYAQQQCQQQETVQRRFVAYVMNYIHAYQHEYLTLCLDLASIQEVLELAYRLQMNKELLAVLCDGMQFFQARGFYNMAEQYLWYVWEAVSQQGNVKEQAIVLRHLAFIQCKQGNYARAKELAQQGLGLTDTLDEKQVRGNLLQTLGTIADTEGDVARADAYYQEGLQLARQARDTFLLCTLYGNCGYIAWVQGQITQAFHYFEETVQLARQYQYLGELGVALNNLGGLWIANGNHAEAEHYLQEGLLVAQQVGEREDMCYLYHNLGEIAVVRGDFARANDYYQQGQEQARLLQNPAHLTFLLVGQGECLIAQNDYIQARQILQEAVALARQIKHTDYLWYALAKLGVAIAYVEDYAHAIAYFQESLELAQQRSTPFRLVDLFVGWGEAALFHDQFSTARQHFQEVLTLDAENQHYPNWQAFAHYGLAHIALHEQNMEQAYEHATESLKLFQQVGHYKAQEVQTWLEVLVKDHQRLLEQHLAAQDGTAKERDKLVQS